jgi:hypothetical protein
MTFAEIAELVGGLPASAYRYGARVKSQDVV